MNETLKLLLQTVVSGTIGFLVAWFTARLQKKTKKIIYHNSSTPLLRFKPGEKRSLNVTVKKSLLTGKPEDEDEVPVDSAYGHSLTIKNIGNDIAENLTLHIEFDSETKILEFSTIPEPSDRYDISFIKPRHSLNRLKLYIPYVNEKDIIHAAILTTKNEDINDIKITGEGKNISIKKYSFKKEFIKLTAAAILILLAIFFFDSETAPNFINNDLLEFMGGELDFVNKLVVKWPVINMIAGFGIAFLVAFILIMHAASKSLNAEAKKLWEDYNE